ncbi:hypothetical protein ACS0TY_025432 [Phlomoides rotata]
MNSLIYCWNNPPNAVPAATSASLSRSPLGVARSPPPPRHSHHTVAYSALSLRVQKRKNPRELDHVALAFESVLGSCQE